MKYPNHFTLNSYDKAIMYCEVINVGELNDKIWLKLPDTLAQYLTLTEMNCIGVDNNGTPIDIENKVQRLTNRIWLEVDISVFDLKPGFHMYQLVFDDKGTDEPVSLYFCYQIQDNNPDKEYIYMKREDI